MPAVPRRDRDSGGRVLMAHLTRRQRKLRARRAANAFANGHRRPIDLIQPNPGAYDQFREIIADADRAAASMFLGPLLLDSPYAHGRHVAAALTLEEERIRIRYGARLGVIVLGDTFVQGPRRYSDNDDVELLGRRLEPQPRIGEKMARLLKSPIAKEVPLPRTNEIHESPCEHCPSARNAARGIEDPESADIKAGSRAYQIESVFRCAWRPEKNCKGYCDFLNVTEADLATRTT